MRELTLSKLNEIFRTVLELPADVDVTSVRQETASGWDSLAHVLLVGAIESEFGLQIDVGDSLDLMSYDAIALYLEERGL